MSYLGCPRIHVMGLFYTNPGNLNNLAVNYNLEAPLEYNTGLYKNPSGVAQFWLQNCVVTSVVGPDGVPCADARQDSLVGAEVLSASPSTPLEEGAGYSDLAKIADLDPNMQFRSELYGLRIAVRIPGGGGFSGRVLVPQLRDLYFSRTNAGINGLQSAVGTWHQRLVQVVWEEPSTPSAVYDALRKQGGAGLDVKLAVDMYQTRLEEQFSQGNIFGYGRLIAAIGPAGVAHPHQLVPGRRLYSITAFGARLATETVSYSSSFTRDDAESRTRAVANLAVWNRTDFRVQKVNDRHLLLVDLAGTFPLRSGGQGRWDLSGPVTFGLDTASGFQPLKNGQVVLDTYRTLDDATAALKDCVWPADSAIVQLELDESEVEPLGRTPLAVRLDQTVLLRENTNGLYVNVDQASGRMEPQRQTSVPVYVYRFGQPLQELPPGLTLNPQVSIDANEPKLNAVKTTQDIAVELATTGTEAGLFQMTVKTGPAVPPQPIRAPLDSQLYLVAAQGADFLVGEDNGQAGGGPPPAPLFSLLFWLNHFVVESPSWDTNIAPIMRRYARLYPGMKGRLDISDEATVKGFAAQMKRHYSASREDPAFMPVVRDLSPSAVDMMLKWLSK